MDNTQGRSSSTADGRVASVGIDVVIGQRCGRRPWRVFPDEQDALTAGLEWEYGDYVK